MLDSSISLAAEQVFSLPSGPYPIGFGSVDQYDYTRTYRAQYTVTGEIESRERARPVQTSVWYPAAKAGKHPMIYGDYIELQDHQEGPPEPHRVGRSKAENGKYMATQPGGSEAFEAILAAPVKAYRDIPAARGRFPVIVYNAGGGEPSWDNSVLFEYFASHGYVVIACPSTWNWERQVSLLPLPPESDALERQSAEAAARDLEFLIGYARSLPFVDMQRLAVMGYSWGGLAGPLVAARNSAVAAVINLDGSVKYHPKVFQQSLHHDLKFLRATFLQFSQNPERVRLAAGVRGQEMDPAEYELLTQPFSFYEGICYSDAYHVVMEHFHHGNFQSSGIIFDTDRREGEPTLADDQAGYAALGRFALAFLDAYLKGERAARDWLRHDPQQNGIEAGTMQVSWRPASDSPPPTIEGFARYARVHGFGGLQALVARVRATDSTYVLSEADVQLWAELLEESGNEPWAQQVRTWATELYPDSASILTALCESTHDRIAQHSCWERVLKLDPESTRAREALKEPAGS